MRKTMIALATATTLLAGPALQARDRPSGEERLAKILEGREAGKPVDCIPLSATRSTRVIDKTAIIYDQGSVIYVNRPNNARNLDDDDVLVTATSLSQLCRVDIVRTIDRSNFFLTGFVGLNEFVPYRKVASAN